MMAEASQVPGIDGNAKGANIMSEPKKNKPAELTEGQLEEVSGGDLNGDVIVQPMAFKYCAANPDHVYPDIHAACPMCGCREFTRA